MYRAKGLLYKIILFMGIGVILLGVIKYRGKEVSYLQDDICIEIMNYINQNDTSSVIRNDIKSKYKGPIPREEKIAYITIDDGPSKYTNEILDILKKHDIKATFFMMNNNMKRYPDEVNRMIEEGHSVGFHSVTHDKDKIYKTTDATINEFDTCNNTLKSITGKESRLIRLPYGSKPYMPEENYHALLNHDYLIWDWNLDTEDWKSTSDKIVSNVLYQGINLDDVVLLMHEKEQSVESLEYMIKVLKERGYDIVPISEYEVPRNYWVQNLDI